MLAVGGAFKSGAYEGFGKRRGDLAATTAELLLADNAFRPMEACASPVKLLSEEQI